MSPPPPPLALTALIYPAESNPAVYIGRVAEARGILASSGSIAEALADLNRVAEHMLPNYHLDRARALYREQQPGMDEWPGTFTITHDPEASAAEAARILEALSAPVPAPEKMLPASQVAEVLRGLIDDSQHEATDDFKRGINHERKLNAKLLRAAASQLGITL